MQTILVCDDDREIVEAIEIYLQQEGYQVLKAYDGEEALQILKENEVHLLIMDILRKQIFFSHLLQRMEVWRLMALFLGVCWDLLVKAV